MSRRLLCVGEHIEVDICKSVLSEEGGLTATQRDSASTLHCLCHRCSGDLDGLKRPYHVSSETGRAQGR